MRYRDAQHVDVGSFYARSPGAGKLYRILGHAGVAAAAIAGWRHDAGALAILLLVLIVVWLAAWYQVVGTLWRASVVAGIVACAILLAAERCRAECASCHASTAPMPGATP
jgi:hypothetical protein